MRIARCTDDRGTQWCRVDGDKVWVLEPPAEGELPARGAASREDAPIEEPNYATPTDPGIVLIALENFPSARNPEPPPNPRLFPKGIRTLVPYGADVVLPAEPSRVMAEPELAVVIGATARNVAAEDVDDYVYGFACFNDVTAVFDDGRAFDFFQAKARDTFGPYGPWVETDVRPADTIAGLTITCRVDGDVVIEDSTRNLIFDVRAVVAEATRTLTLQPGDIISLGSPLPPPFVTAGHTVEFEIEGIGSLRNEFVAP
jgi:2-keto-4-pentenoate hydratase/2-oxohepta-3-ene-1,7-dioic acid hydratase in catechol pathway